MKSSDIIKDIRSRLNLSQTELADKLGVSFATVNRWEKGHRTPSQIALGNIKRLCADNKIDYAFLAGPEMKYAADALAADTSVKTFYALHAQEWTPVLKELLQKRGGTCLLKASRSMNFETLLKEI